MVPSLTPTTSRSPKMGFHMPQNTRMAISPQRVIRYTSCLVLGKSFHCRRIEWRYFHMFIWTDMVIIYFISRLQMLSFISEKRFHVFLVRFNSVQLHLYIWDFDNITYRCHLLPRFPPLLLGATLSTPAFSVALQRVIRYTSCLVLW